MGLLVLYCHCCVLEVLYNPNFYLTCQGKLHSSVVKSKTSNLKVGGSNPGGIFFFSERQAIIRHSMPTTSADMNHQTWSIRHGASDMDRTYTASDIDRTYSASDRPVACLRMSAGGVRHVYGMREECGMSAAARIQMPLCRRCVT